MAKLITLKPVLKASVPVTILFGSKEDHLFHFYFCFYIMVALSAVRCLWRFYLYLNRWLGNSFCLRANVEYHEWLKNSQELQNTFHYLQHGPVPSSIWPLVSFILSIGRYEVNECHIFIFCFCLFVFPPGPSSAEHVQTGSFWPLWLYYGFAGSFLGYSFRHRKRW